MPLYRSFIKLKPCVLHFRSASPLATPSSLFHVLLAAAHGSLLRLKEDYGHYVNVGCSGISGIPVFARDLLIYRNPQPKHRPTFLYVCLCFFYLVSYVVGFKVEFVISLLLLKKIVGSPGKDTGAILGLCLVRVPSLAFTLQRLLHARPLPAAAFAPLGLFPVAAAARIAAAFAAIVLGLKQHPLVAVHLGCERESAERRRIKWKGHKRVKE